MQADFDSTTLKDGVAELVVLPTRFSLDEPPQTEIAVEIHNNGDAPALLSFEPVSIETAGLMHRADTMLW